MTEFLNRLERERAANDITPPWERFPEYTATTLGWRMGAGEEWMWAWRDWFATLPNEQARLTHPQNAKSRGSRGRRRSPLTIATRESSRVRTRFGVPHTAHR